MRKTRTFVVAGIAALAMALPSTAAAAAPLNPGVWGAPSTSEAAPTPTPKLPVCRPPDCRYV